MVYNVMKQKTVDNKLFSLNRKNFAKQLKSNSLAVFQSNDEFPRSGDQTFIFKQNPDLYYLSGIDQEQTVLLIFPDCPNPQYKEVLFLRQTNDYIKVWEGYKYTKEQAREASGIQAIYWLEDFDAILQSIVNYADSIYLNSNENDRYVSEVAYRDLRFIQQMKAKFPLHHFERAAPIMRNLRMVKSEVEIALVQKACNVTKDAFTRVLKFVKPGIEEFEIEAEVTHEFLRQGATGHAYSPIIASGYNATILHYNDNSQTCKNGDVILFDFGAEYANYNADMSRSIPVGGRFSERQAAVYKSVLHVMKEATKLLKPGTQLTTYHEQVGELMTEQLVNLKLLTLDQVKNQDKQMPAYKKYFMHGTSHHLGIDVHDFAGRYTPFAEGNILTVEPGIYIPEENLGIRLEDNILITAGGTVNLMADIPLELEEIEDIMNS